MAAASAEIEALKAAVAHRFQVQGVIVTPLALTFQVAPGPNADQSFDELRKDLIPRDYIPSMTRERGELLVHVQRRPPQRYRSVRVNVIMLLLTIATTVLFGGAWNWSTYSGAPWLSADSILNGAVFFSLPLLAILGCHEMGHYVVAKRHGVRASLPFFIPSVPPLGTFGAFISMRDPLPNRRALLDVGASGPLVGFAIAIPVTIAGLFLTAANPRPLLPSTGTFELIQGSFFYNFLAMFFPIAPNQSMHPLAFAGWVGLFVTAINLLPASQLDGGHVARALLGSKQYYASWASFAFLIGMTLVSGYQGWIIFALFIFFIGLRHPPPLNDLQGLGVRRTVVGLVAVAVLAATFVPVPFAFVSAQPALVFEDLSGRTINVMNISAVAGGIAYIKFAVNDTGLGAAMVRLSFDSTSTGNLEKIGFTFAFMTFSIGTNTTTVNGATASFGLQPAQRAIVNVSVGIPASAARATPWVFFVDAQAGGDPPIALTVNLTVT